MKFYALEIGLCAILFVSALPTTHGLLSLIRVLNGWSYVDSFDDMLADFGGDLSVFTGLQGLLVNSSPEDACTPVAPPPKNFTDELTHWFLLIERCPCNYDVKIRHAQLAGYSAAIVYNVNSSKLVVMRSNNASDIVIPAMFITSGDGKILKEKYLYDTGNQIFLLHNDAMIAPWEILIICSAIISCCFIGVLLYAIYKCCAHLRRLRNQRLPIRALKRLPLHKFTANDLYETCVICLEDYKLKQTLRILPCLHAYHKDCIDPWLSNGNRVCPVCKRRVKSQSTSESDSDDETQPLLQASSSAAPSMFQIERLLFFRSTTFLHGSSSSSHSPPSSGSSESYNSASGSPSSTEEPADVRSLYEEPSVNV